MRGKIEPIGAAILAGGKSSRMGQNKALLPYHNARLIDHVIHVVGEIGCSPVVVSGAVDGYRCIHDRYKNCGPMGGIHAVSEAAIQENMPKAWLFIPVDMPLITSGLLARLYSCACTYDQDGACFENKPLPLFLRLNERVVKCLEKVELKLLSNQKISVKNFLEDLEICHHPLSDLERALLANTNTPEEWREAVHESSHQ